MHTYTGRLDRLVHFTFLALAFLLIPGSISSYQTGSTTGPGSAEPPDPPKKPQPMGFQPPPDADSIEDFIPPGALQEQLNGPPGQQLAADIPLNQDVAYRFNDDRLAVIVEQDTFDEAAQLSMTELAEPKPTVSVTHTISEPLPSQTVMRFQLEVQRGGDGKPIHDFDKQVRLVVDLRPYVQERNPEYSDFFLAYQDEESRWHQAPVEVHGAEHQEEGLISADVGHFSNWAAGVDPEGTPAPWRLHWQPPAVSTFSGAATYNFPVDVPPGRAGFTPSLNVNYSSRGVDGIIFSDEIDDGPLGLGWSISNIEISRTFTDLFWDGGNYILKHGDKFSLSINGRNHALELHNTTGGGTVYHYVARNAPGLKVQMIVDAAAPSEDGIYWKVQTPEGITYRLGYTQDSESGQDVWPNSLLSTDGNQPGGSRADYGSLRWRVDTATDRHGNQIQYDYDNWDEEEEEYQREGSVTRVTTSNARLKEVRYNYANLAANPDTRVGGTYASRVTLGFSSVQAPIVYTIELYHQDVANPYRIIDIGVNDDGIHNNLECGLGYRDSGTRKVTSIAVKTGDGAYTLPPTTFSYVWKQHRSAYQSCYEFEHLKEVHNGYGGRVKFTYEGDGRWDQLKYGQTFYVTKREAFDGIHDPAAAVTDYDYDTPCYDQLSGDKGQETGAFNCPTRGDISGYTYPHGPLVGFQKTTVTHTDYDGTSTHREISGFHQDQLKMGMPYQVDVTEADAGSTLLRRTSTVYAPNQTINGIPDMFTFAQEVRTIHHDGGQQLGTKVRNHYQTQYQGGQQWGKRTQQDLYLIGDGNEVLHKRQRTRYRTNTATWRIVPWVSATYDPGWQPLKMTLSLYDGNTNNPDTQTITDGQLTLRRSLLVDTPISQGGDTLYDSVDTAFKYDAYGNRTDVTTYGQYGRAGHDGANWNQSVLATDPRTTTMVYDNSPSGGFHLYPVEVTNPASHTVHYAYYGFDGVPVDGFQVQPGLLKSVTDPNGVATRYEYDPFGRLHAVYDGYDNFAGFGDMDPHNGDPLKRYAYWDNTWNNSVLFLNPANDEPLVIGTEQRPSTWSQAVDGFAYVDQEMLDGFGRVIQTRSIWHEVEGQSQTREIYTITEYNARGKVTCESPAFDVPFYDDRGLTWPQSPYLTDTCAGHLGTTTTYDALGRPGTVTAPDGTQTQHYYAIGDDEMPGEDHFRTSIVDANSHAVTRGKNALGQLAYVQEYEGTSSYQPYALTKYEYDILGNLHKVTDADNNVTTITYDALSRKISMTDPDMGHWEYEYDPAGNLVRQKDARGQVICFDYDVLDRLLRRAQDETPASACPGTLPASGATHLASYSYDGAANGVGQVHTVSWGPQPGDNRDVFSYDSLGRAYKQVRSLDGRQYTMETLSYDALGRPLTVRRPNGEIIEYTYDREGQNSLKAGNDLLIGDVRYNGREQLAFLERVHNGGTTSAPATITTAPAATSACRSCGTAASRTTGPTSTTRTIMWAMLTRWLQPPTPTAPTCRSSTTTTSTGWSAPRPQAT